MLLDDARRYKEDLLDPPAIESGLEDVIAKLETLQDSFNKIHRTDSMDQVGEDYAISDEDWAGMKTEAAQAEKNLSVVANGFQKP